MPQKIIDELNTEGRQESAREKAGRKGADRYSRQKETRYTEALKSENTALGKRVTESPRSSAWHLRLRAP